MYLGTLGYSEDDGTLISFGIDWRRPLDFNIAQLQAKIEGALARTGETAVDIVAHSHGGLVARKYMQKFGGGHVQNLITFGTPHKGMLETFKALCEGIELFGFSQSHIMKVARTFPSAYELLPVDPGDGMFEAGGSPADPFATNGWATGGISKPMLQDASASVQSLDTKLPVKTTLIAGTHRSTWSLAQANGASKVKFTQRDDGDGTVPSISASGAALTSDRGVSRFVIPYGVHSQLFDYPEARRLLKNTLLPRPMSHFSIGLESPTYVPGKTFGVGVDIRDSAGNVPADATAQITIKGAGTKTFTLPRTRDDFFARLPMPGTPVHLQYRVEVSAPSLGETFGAQVGVIFAANHS